MNRVILDPSKAAGDLYSSVVVSPESIARRASTTEVLERVIALTSKLSADKYTTYISEFYARGLEIAGEAWGFMDIVSVLYAVAEMGTPENYLEIGVRRGRSACAIAAASPETKIFAFDMWQQDYAGNENPGPDLVRQELSKAGHVGELTFIDGDSHKTVPEFLRQNPDLSFDCITVDGDHSTSGAWDDLRNVAPRLRIGGVLVFDDTNNPYCPGLNEVWKDLIHSDKGLRSFSYNLLGTGISFAIRVSPCDSALPYRRRFWKR